MLKCLRCGYCCIHCTANVPIGELPDDYYTSEGKYNPDDYVFDDKPAGTICRYLVIDEETKIASCLMYDKKYYRGSPCDKHGAEYQDGIRCGIGEYILSQSKD